MSDPIRPESLAPARKMRELFKTYEGPLTPAETAEGIRVALENMADLIADAGLLFEAGRYARSISLAVLAIEEFGKVAILRGILVAKDAATLKQEWRKYRSHSAKNRMWLLPQMLTPGNRFLDHSIGDFESLLDDKAGHSVLLDTVKQSGFYTGINASKGWMHPRHTFDETSARSILETARWFKASDPQICTEAELALWKGHMERIQTAPDASSLRRIVGEYYADAAAQGLIVDPPSGDDLERHLAFEFAAEDSPEGDSDD